MDDTIANNSNTPYFSTGAEQTKIAHTLGVLLEREVFRIFFLQAQHTNPSLLYWFCTVNNALAHMYILSHRVQCVFFSSCCSFISVIIAKLPLRHATVPRFGMFEKPSLFSLHRTFFFVVVVVIVVVCIAFSAYTMGSSVANVSIQCEGLRNAHAYEYAVNLQLVRARAHTRRKYLIRFLAIFTMFT